MNDVEFFDIVVQPTVEEFRELPSDIRLASLACIVLAAMAEHYFAHHKNIPEEVLGCKSVGDFKSKLRAEFWAYDQIMDVANGMKHITLIQGKKKGSKPFHELHLQIPGELEIMRCGYPLSSEPHLFIGPDNDWILQELTDCVAQRWHDCIHKGIASLIAK